MSHLKAAGRNVSASCCFTWLGCVNLLQWVEAAPEVAVHGHISSYCKYWCCLRCKSRLLRRRRAGKRPGWTLIRLAGSKVHSGAAIPGLAQPALSDPTPLIWQLHPHHTLSHPPILQLCLHFDTTLFFCDAKKHPQHTHTHKHVCTESNVSKTD